MPSAQKLVDKFNDLKTLPHVAIRVTQMAGSETATMQDFEEVIKLDPVLVVRLLRLVNSPYFGLSSHVESIAKAVIFIGMKHLRNLVAVEGLRNLFRERAEETIFSRKNLWTHSATVAILAQMISRRIFGEDGEDVFLAGIIHDIGLIVEDQLCGEKLRQVCSIYSQEQGEESITGFEDGLIGTNHSKIGRLLAIQWHLSDEVVEAIRFHHRHDKQFPIPSVIAILQLAEFMACKMNQGVVIGRSDPLPAYLADHLKSKMAEYKVLLKALPAEMAKARELYDADQEQA
ncbi:MAG: metal-dependent phosphohydrolase [Desulfobulbaceae bacterium DB1]|nr:MAG: metal-dependent phosphohydrolase [Desulfobulbaceae bacterium DB1]